MAFLDFDESKKNNGTYVFINKEELIKELVEIIEIKELSTFKERIGAVRLRVQQNNDSQLPLKSQVNNGFTEISTTSIVEDLDQILRSRTIERSKYYLNRLIEGLTTIKESKINDINLNRWKDYEDILTDSLWIIDKRDRTGAHNAEYWGNFVPQIPYQLLNRYTKKEEWVLDTFVGSGTTLIECKRQGRNGIGIDIAPEAVKLALKNVGMEDNPLSVRTELINADSTNLDYRKELKRLGVDSVQFILMHPPYWDIIKFNKDPNNLSNAASLELFLKGIRSCVESTYEILDDGRYLALVIGDKYSKGEWIPLGFHAMNEVIAAGYKLKSIIVKNFEETKGKKNQKELWRYRALSGGFYVFKHEYIFLFQK